MTEPTIQSDDPIQRPAGGGFAAAVAPEGVAAVLAIAVVAVLLTVRLAGFGVTGLAPTPSPADGASPAATIAGPTVDRVAINTVLGVDERLLDFSRSLQAELDKPPVAPDKVRTTFAQMSVQLFAGAPAAARLRDAPATALVGTDVSAVYAQLRTKIDEANDFRLSEETNWRASAKAVVETLKALPAIDLRLAALRAGLADPAAPEASSVPPSSAPTDSPPPSAPPVTPAPPTTPPTAPPTAGSTVPPSTEPTPTSSPPLAEPNQLQNPGFETGADPWVLVTANLNVHASMALDTTTAHGGKTSYRIDITNFDGNPQSISLQQGGVTLEQGAKYRVSIALRSSADRQVRVRVTSNPPPGQTYGRQTLFIGPTWTVQTFEFDTAVGGSERLFTLEVGQAGGTVWIDDASIARVSPFAP